MSNLRRQALESRKVQSQSKKTVSRKARARAESASLTSSPLATPPHSRNGSRNPSRNPSRAPSRADSRSSHNTDSNSEAEEDQPDAILATIEQLTIEEDEGDDEFPHIPVKPRFDVLCDKIQDRDFFKGANHARAVLLRLFADELAAKYLDEPEQHSQLEDLLPILLRCLREGNANEVAAPAARAIGLVVITLGDEWFQQTGDALKAAVCDASGSKGQMAAVHALGAAAFWGGADFQEVAAVMDLFLRIAESNGEAVEAKDDSGVVTAALEEWGLLSTLLQEPAKRAERALEVFEQNLESSHPDVLMAAGENIALVLEQNYVPNHSEDDGQDIKDGDEDGLAQEQEDEHVRYTYRRANYRKVRSPEFNKYGIKDRAKELSNSTLRFMKKDSRRELHKVFRDIVHSLDYPWRGPHYAAVIDVDGLFYYGHREEFDDRPVDRWWKHHRINALRRFVATGKMEHVYENPNMEDFLTSQLMPLSRFITYETRRKDW